MVTPELTASDPGAWQQVARLDELVPGTPIGKQVGNKHLVLVNHEGALFALDGVCPHKHGSLADGKIVLGELACPVHGFRYDLRTGTAAVPKAVPGVRAYALKVEGNDVLVDVRHPLRGEAT